MDNEGNSRKGYPFLAIAAAIALLFLLSLVPWSSLTGGRIKDFNLLSDLFPSKEDNTTGNEIIDPALLEAMNENAENAGETVSEAIDSMTAKIIEPGMRPATAPAMPDRDVENRPSRIDDNVVIEDYTVYSDAMARFYNALQQSASYPVRVAVIGDSYIEGDIFTKDIRSMLQTEYGGSGVGYMPAHSIVQGFRTTVRHDDSGWTPHGIRDRSGCLYYNLQGEYFTGGDGATITYKGTKGSGLKDWQLSRLLFVAPADGTISITTDSGEQTFEVSAADEVQQILVDERTSSLRIVNHVPGLALLGTWLEDANGVVVDNMSLRGYSGINHRNLDPGLAAQMRRFVDYDLIVVEYGINALSSSQSDYRRYSDMMSAAVSRIRECYPDADIVLMGVGDRGQKVNGAVHSLPTTQNMVDAQRRAARNSASAFWDTREAMGGEDAIVEWRNQHYVNPDYIHLNAKGGRKLAELFVNALLR